MWALFFFAAWLGQPATAAERRTPIVIAVERATPAVVAVQVEVEQQNPLSWWGPRLAASEGSGVVIGATGVVLTNAHVVEGARSIRVSTSNGQEYIGRVTALEHDLDLAVVQLQGAANLATAQLGDSDGLFLGETVVAIGNPLGLGLTVSTGVIGSVRRDIEVRPGLSQTFIQTDAAINPGNSGGALVDINGRLVGINTAIRADAEGIGFAIPVNRAIKVAADLVHYGAVRAPWLGIASANGNGAVLIRKVVKDGPAAAAGMQPGDVILQVNGDPAASRADLNLRLAEASPGDEVVVNFLRGGRHATATLLSTSVPDDLGVRAVRDTLGIEVLATNAGLQIKQADPAGQWTQSKLRVGDLIVAVDGKPVVSSAELFDALRRAGGQHRGAALFTVRRGPYQGHVSVDI